MSTGNENVDSGSTSSGGENGSVPRPTPSVGGWEGWMRREEPKSDNRTSRLAVSLASVWNGRLWTEHLAYK
jgi:hypothetical protein